MNDNNKAMSILLIALFLCILGVCIGIVFQAWDVNTSPLPEGGWQSNHPPFFQFSPTTKELAILVVGIQVISFLISKMMRKVKFLPPQFFAGIIAIVVFSGQLAGKNEAEVNLELGAGVLGICLVIIPMLANLLLKELAQGGGIGKAIAYVATALIAPAVAVLVLSPTYTKQTLLGIMVATGFVATIKKVVETIFGKED